MTYSNQQPKDHYTLQLLIIPKSVSPFSLQQWVSGGLEREGHNLNILSLGLISPAVNQQRNQSLLCARTLLGNVCYTQQEYDNNLL